jgi:hypothetical protein
MTNYSEEQFWKIYKNLPTELQEALLSTESSDYVYKLCEENNVEKASEIVKYIGDILIGNLPPEKFQETLEKELNIENEIAKKLVREINRFVFLPVRPFLERLYKTKDVSLEAIPEKSEQKKIETEEESADQKDVYREPIV